ncbi:hypothetical protein [Escherichia phage EP_H11]|nr:hypothetical protein [Escherichia phage EP_H11]
MTYNALPYENKWYEDIRRLEKTDKGEGGPVEVDSEGAPIKGFLNHPLMQLAARTGYLKEFIDNYTKGVTFVVSSEEEMLGLDAKPGVTAIRSDISKIFVLMTVPASTIGNWTEMLDGALVLMGQPTGAQKSGYRYSDVYSALSRMLTYQDYNIPQPALGRDTTANQTIWDDQSQIDLKHRGGIFAGKETFGIRENSTVASFRANTASGSAFVPQVAGSDDLAVLAQAGALDSVAVFADTWLGEYNSWEDIATADYTATSFTVSDASLLTKVKVGQCLMTKHASKYVGLVTAISGTTVTVQKWVIYGTTTVGTPANGVGLYINPVIKGWAFNGNVLIGPNSRAEKCALMELGLQNNGIADVALLTGADIVSLDAAYGGGDGVRVRGASANARWDNNIHAYGGVKTNYRSSDGSGGAVCSLAAFYEESASAIGFLFSGKNASRSLSFNNSSGVEQAALAPYGFEVKGGKGLSTASDNVAIASGGKVAIPNATAFNLVLPDPTNFTPGREIHLVATGVGTLAITSSGGFKVNGNTTANITPTHGFTELTATYYGSSTGWYVTW